MGSDHRSGESSRHALVSNRLENFTAPPKGRHPLLTQTTHLVLVAFVSEIAPSLHPVVIVKVDPDTGELVRGPNGLAVKTKVGEVGQIVGRGFKGEVAE